MSESSKNAQLGPRSLHWWTGGRGWAGVAQPPNAAIAVWAVASILRWVGVGHPSGEKLLEGLGLGALLVWALDELLRGVSPIRRIMGAVVLAVLAVRMS